MRRDRQLVERHTRSFPFCRCRESAPATPAQHQEVPVKTSHLCFSPQKTLQPGENSVTVALHGYVCRDDARPGVLRQVLFGWTADDSTLTALMPYRRGFLPSVRAFIDRLAAELPKAVRF